METTATQNTNVLLTKCEVKMDTGRVLVLHFMDKNAKKGRRYYLATLTEQVWSIKDFLYDEKNQE